MNTSVATPSASASNTHDTARTSSPGAALDMRDSATRRRTTAADDIRWRAIVERSTTSTDPFFYGVRTTMVYCRANCASRRPLRRNVEIFESSASARDAGYRACRRCRPDDDERPEWITLVCRTIEASLACPTLAELSDLVGFSPSHVQRTFRRTMGVSPYQYGAAVRAARLRTELTRGTPVTQAIFDAGFSSSGTAYVQSRAVLGMTPKRFHDGGRGEQISYTVMTSPYGEVLVAATTKGIVAVRIGDEVELVRQLRSEFANANLVRDDAVVTPTALEVLDRIVHHRAMDDLPLDIAATAFQAKVWAALRAIPSGSTRSYSEIAQQIGEPRSARAVAGACAQNPVALVIPCHRVVHADGSLSGYRWGVTVKARLIDDERRERAGGFGPA